jgi:hypothetical protein
MSPESATRGDEAQRALERKALRNVRNLVDKLEDEQRAQSKTTLRFAAGAVVVALAVAGIVFFTMGGTKSPSPTVVSQPAKAVPR